MTWSYNPEGIPSVWAPSAFARHYLRNRFLFLFLRLLRCFTSAGFAFHTLCVQSMEQSVLPRSGYPIRISPDHRLLAASEAFRGLPRPSSPVGTKAFTVRPYLLHHIASCYHFHNTTKPFRDLLYCLIAWYACLSCVFVVVVQLPTLMKAIAFSNRFLSPPECQFSLSLNNRFCWWA